MKKLIYLLFAIALFSSCEKDELVEQSHQGGTAGNNLPEVLYVSMADEQDSQSRTVLDGKTVLWQQGDAISFFAGDIHNVKYMYNGETPASKVELDKVDETGATKTAILLFY